MPWLKVKTDNFRLKIKKMKILQDNSTKLRINSER